MENYKEIFIPKETVSDDTVRIVELKSSSGSKVLKGEIVFSIETSKSVIEIESPISGFITHKLKLSESIPIGELAAIVSAEELPIKTVDKLYDCNKKIKSNKKSDNSSKTYKNFSKKALDLIDREGLNIIEFSNIPFVRVKDVEAFILKDQVSVVLDEVSNKQYSANDIIIIGGGGHAKMCIDIIKRLEIYNPVGILDSLIAIGTNLSGVPIIGVDGNLQLQGLYNKGLRLAVNCVGSVKERADIFKKLKNIGFSIPEIIHPMAIIEPSAIIMEGAQIMMGASVGSYCVQ